ncbi:MAG: NAD(P)H-hydrate dehydratase [Oscillospiraceae bacterium]|nr:NAD(P)H-hydrate dehydratase [Oscillospiraceae bacterium]
MLIISTSQMREIEQKAIQGGMDELRLMENAGSAAARLIRSKFDIAGKRVALLCGKGNNGGDGFVIARKLMEEGATVTVILTCGKPSSSNAAEMLSRILKSDARIVDLQSQPYVAENSICNAELIVDAIFGIGFKGELPNYLRGFLRIVNQCLVPVIAVDVPSGVNADTGEYDTDAIKANLTVTFTANKTGLVSKSGVDLCGEVYVVSIGIDEQILKQYRPSQNEINLEMVGRCFSKRAADTNKGDYGRLLTLCGSTGMAGAAVLAVRAALRCGVGLVEAAVPATLYPIVASQLCEPIFLLLEQTASGDFALHSRSVLREHMRKADAVLIGCGLGQSAGAESLVIDCLVNAHCPIVLDADGINIAAKHINRLKTVRAPLIMTPHPGEMARLTGKSIAEIQSNRAQAAQLLCDQTGAIIVLKGHQTVIAAPGQSPFINTVGNPGMATGGSGDVLAGMIAAFAAQGLNPLDAVICGVHLHGLAGDRAAARLSQHYMLPSDIIDELSGLFLILEK